MRLLPHHIQRVHRHVELYHQIYELCAVIVDVRQHNVNALLLMALN